MVETGGNILDFLFLYFYVVERNSFFFKMLETQGLGILILLSVVGLTNAQLGRGEYNCLKT